MPSPAAVQFNGQLERPRTLAKLAQDNRLRPIDLGHAQVCYHAALAAYVAAWDTFVKKLSKDFLVAVSDPHSPKFFVLHALLESRLTAGLEKFNTPNWENTRELLRAYSGYEPLNDWIWPRGKMNSIEIRSRLNEILKVRHSFAHGHPMPAYQWNTSSSGEARLTKKIITDVDSFFSNLAMRTDRGMHKYIQTTFGLPPVW